MLWLRKAEHLVFFIHGSGHGHGHHGAVLVRDVHENIHGVGRHSVILHGEGEAQLGKAAVQKGSIDGSILWMLPSFLNQISVYF